MSLKSLDSSLQIRLPTAVRKDFQKKATRYGNPSQVLREIIQAFIDDRLVIQPNPRKESLYVTRK